MSLYDLDKYAQKARQAAAEGAVLIRNENEVLPLIGKTKVALFGRTQFNYYKSGTGSGGLVNTRYVVGIYEALVSDEDILLNTRIRKEYEDWVLEHPFDKGIGWAAEPWFQEEMPLLEESVLKAAEESDVAIVIIGRTAGEDKDAKAEAGSYLLTDTEKDMLSKVCNAFDKTIVLLNVGNIIDMKWVDEYKPQAVLYVWQGGQEGGLGVLDVLKGNINPSGRLNNTIALDIDDYFSNAYFGGDYSNKYTEDIYVGYRYFETFAKEKVLYPFGYGLSYTQFDVKLIDFIKTEDGFEFSVDVTNIGKYAGKYTALIYVNAPQGRLGKPALALAGFKKTGVINPGESRTVQVNVSEYDISSYDDGGVTGHKSAYVLEEGVYGFYLGGDVRTAKRCTEYRLSRLKIVEKLSEALAPVEEFSRIKPMQRSDGSYEMIYEPVPLRSINPMDKRAASMPDDVPYIGENNYKLKDVKEGKITLDEFIGGLTDEDLCYMVRGEGMSPMGVTPGVAGAFGGITERLLGKGIPKAACADGPSGIRMDCGTKAFAMPNGTCIACSFNEKLIGELYEYEGMELRKNHVDTLLGPGMNIHRNPLNGRNFEYFSEDPLVTGKMALAEVKAMQKYGVTGTIKHFALNSQEHMRSTVDAVISERAAREIYLKGFEIAVKGAGAFCLMTSYNKINGIYAAGNYDLVTSILRNEWGFDGIVMTDWWALANEEGQKGVMANTALLVRAQNDLFMVMPDAGLPSAQDTSREGLEQGTVTRAEYVRSAKNILKTLMRLPAYAFLYSEKTPLDLELDAFEDPYDEGSERVIEVSMSETPDVYYIDDIDTSKGMSNIYNLKMGGGAFRLTFEACVTGGNELAQVPLSIFKEHNLLKTITLTGRDSSFASYTVEPIVAHSANSFLKFYFGQGGMKIRNCILEKVMSMDELMKKMEEYRNSGEAF